MFRTTAVAFLFATSAALAQAPDLQIRLDAATFAYTLEESLVEVYVSFGAATLPFAEDSTGHVAALPVTVEVLPVATAAPEGVARVPVYAQDIVYRYVVGDPGALTTGQVFVEQVRAAVPPGEYELALTVTPAGASELQLRRDLTVPDYGGGQGSALSSVQLARAITRADDRDDPFFKSGLSVAPNPDGFYGEGIPVVSYYAEVYRPPASGDEYTLLTYLAESDQAGPLPGRQTRQTRAVRPVDVVAGRLDVGDVPSGIYYLRLVVLDAANEAVAEQTKRVYVVNPNVERPEAAVAVMDYEETLFAAMAEEELEETLATLEVIATPREQAQMRALTSNDDRRRFLAAFWRGRDLDVRPEVNDALRQFNERLALANDRYQEIGREGFQTERGRVYIKYGPPSEIDRRVFEANLYPHEVWVYENIPGEGRSLFVFADRFGSDTYELIHSDVTGETSMASWQESLRR
ncbi:MAG: GWxTD domain-containing protein [Bacteroidota bacterium]